MKWIAAILLLLRMPVFLHRLSKIIHHYYYLLLLLLLLGGARADAQESHIAGLNLNKTYPSPDAASLGNFGLVPATPFSGQADVSIPLYELTYKNLEVPITMRYNTGGHKVDDHPGWLGLGWTLQAGGVIVRKVNGVYDEHPPVITWVSWPNEGCYYYNCGRVTSNFNNVDSIQQFTLMGLSPAQIKPQAYDAMPDEFIFNVNGYSGTFYITRASMYAPVELKVKPNGAYKLQAEIIEMRDDIKFGDWIDDITGAWVKRETGRSFYTIRLTDENGIQYTFGGDPNAIDFSNNGDMTRNTYTIASAWHLTTIKAPGGDQIRFTYKRAGRTFIQQKQRNALFYDVNFNFSNNVPFLLTYQSGSTSYSGSQENTVITIQNSVYPDSIITPLQSIRFSSSETNELNFPFDQQKLAQVTASDFRHGITQSHWQKLDAIDIAGVKQIHFNYRHQPTKRLRLSGCDVKTTTSETVFAYSFQYNTLDLPAYNSKKADHWGYFNNRLYAYTTDYLTAREPEAQYMVAEMLETMTYPTGGFLKLTYEPHTYSKIARQFPFTTEQTTNLMAGGLRIRAITSGASATDTMRKEYFYTTNYLNNGADASGVLSGVPQYTNTGTLRNTLQHGFFWLGSWGSFSLYYGKVVDNNFLPPGNTNGNHVTYSEVTEKYDEGYVVYKYTNHDNGYTDKAPYDMFTNFDSKWHEEGFISMEGFRGLLLQMNYYDNNKNFVRNTSYEYTADTSNSYYKVPYFFRLYDVSMGGTPLSRVSTCVFYTKPVLMRKQTDTIQAGAQYIVETKTNRYFQDLYPAASPHYDNYKETEELTTNSTGDEITTSYSYPATMVYQDRDAPGAPYQGMLNANMNAAVVEEQTLKNGNSVSFTRTNYSRHYSGCFLPQSILQQVGNHAGEIRHRFPAYDSTGNILTQVKENDRPESFIWDYQKSFPIARVLNAAYEAVAYTSFEADGQGNFNIPAGKRLDEGITGDKSFLLGGRDYISFNPSSTGVDYIVSYWSKNGPITVDGATSLGVKSGLTRNGWTYHEHTIRTTGGVIALASPAVTIIDELRLYPAGATMTTFTYNPVLGKTSECSAANMITYYSYDQLGRLRFVRDAEGNITRTFEYQYKQQ